MNAVSSHICLLTIFCFGLLFNQTFAGTCWSTMVKNNSGRCKELLYERVSKEDCCSRSNSVTTSWSPEEHDPRTLFFWRMLGGGAQCSLCKETCKNVTCERGKKCLIRKGIPKCVCSSTCKEGKRKLKDNVCGTDGKSYKSLCRLKKKACKQKTHNLFMAYYGLCQNSCDKITCPKAKNCVLDQNLIPHCVHCFKKKCTDVSKQVCGVNGKTYKNACQLREVACLAGRAIPIAYKGPCKENVTCSDIHCPDRQQCLTDLASGGRPRCTECVSACRPKYLRGPICGTNNNTYQTWCHMMHDACAKGYVIDTKHSGKCIKDSE